MDRGDLGGAEALLRDAVAVRPGDMEAGYLLARVLYWRGDRAAAIAAFDRLLALRPGDADFLVGKAFALWFDGRIGEARPILDDVVTRAPGYEDAQRLRLRVLEALGDLPAREEALRGIEARFPGRRAEFLGPPAEKGAVRRGEVEAGVRVDSLSGGRNTWTEEYLAGTFFVGGYAGPDPLARRAVFDLLARDLARYGERDRGAAASLSFPLDADWTTRFGGESSPTHRILPRWGGSAGATRLLGAGWLLHGDLRRVEYAADSVATGSLGVERYAGPWRVEGRLTGTRLLGEGDALGAGLMVDRWYGDGDRSRAGVVLGFGDEIESTPGGVQRTSVLSLSLRGRHWFAPRWAFTWEAGIVRQGSLYTRTGFQVGLRHSF